MTSKAKPGYLPEPSDGFYTHVWTLTKFDASTSFCIKCGIVRRADGQHRKCPGKHPPIKPRQRKP